LRATVHSLIKYERCREYIIRKAGAARLCHRKQYKRQPTGIPLPGPSVSGPLSSAVTVEELVLAATGLVGAIQQLAIRPRKNALWSRPTVIVVVHS
jgi:hypothetical protein